MSAITQVEMSEGYLALSLLTESQLETRIRRGRDGILGLREGDKQ